MDERWIKMEEPREKETHVEGDETDRRMKLVRRSKAKKHKRINKRRRKKR